MANAPFEVYFCECCDQWDVKDDNGVTYLIDHVKSKGLPTFPKSDAIQRAASLRLQEKDWANA